MNIINGNEDIARDATDIKRIMRGCCGQLNNMTENPLKNRQNP